MNAEQQKRPALSVIVPGKGFSGSQLIRHSVFNQSDTDIKHFRQLILPRKSLQNAFLILTGEFRHPKRSFHTFHTRKTSANKIQPRRFVLSKLCPIRVFFSVRPSGFREKYCVISPHSLTRSHTFPFFFFPAQQQQQAGAQQGEEHFILGSSVRRRTAQKQEDRFGTSFFLPLHTHARQNTIFGLSDDDH